jgi:hypothetical protein
MKSKQNFIDITKNGLHADDLRQYGIIACQFHPFDDNLMFPSNWDYERKQTEQSKDGGDVIFDSENAKGIFDEIKYLYNSYIFRGIRYTFKNGDKLKEFVEMVEDQ